MPQEHGVSYSYVNRGWTKSKLVFVPGEQKPKDHASVKGQIHDIVVAHPEGIEGEKLAQLAQKRIRTPRSHHADSAEPDMDWVRRYISGMTRSTFKFLRVIEPDNSGH